ncbi:MAG: YcaQ family DNA glycosylase [Chloroflexota bacterium]|nr:YcaQ family DNA glycosylase [Chloroflexota bacterium]
MTDVPIRITPRDARRLAVAGQRLAAPPPRPTRARALALIRHIGYLQLDPTNVVARNPYLVLWSRLGRYDHALLDDLMRRRELFETPSLLLPMSDLPLHLAAMRAYRRATDGDGPTMRGRLEGAGGGTWPKRAAEFLRKNAALRRDVLARLRREGPLPLTAFEDRSEFSWTSGGWNNERNVTMMLAVLQRRGEVVVAGRRRGQKLWATAHGWYPEVAPLPSRERAREATLRAIRAMGIASAKAFKWYYAFNRYIDPDTLAALVREGALAAVEIEGLRGTWYAEGDLQRRLRVLRDGWEGRTTLLSPFDSLIMDRERLEALFGYRYRMEIYVPPQLRKLGYWAMPVLMGDAIVGSVDPKLDREKGVLVVNKVVLEPGAPARAKRAVRGALEELAEFVGAEKIAWGRAL